MKQITIPSCILIIITILLWSCESSIPRAPVKQISVHIKYENIESVEGEMIVIHRIYTREDPYFPHGSVDKSALTPSRNVYSFEIGPSYENDKNYIDVVGIRRDSIYNWVVDFEERGRDKIPVLVNMHYYFNGIKHTNRNDTITIDLAEQK